MSQRRLPRARSRSGLRHERRFVSLPPRFRKRHFLPCTIFAICTSTRFSRAQPRSRECPRALMPRSDLCRARREIVLRGARLSRQPPEEPAGGGWFPPFPSPPPGFPPPPPSLPLFEGAPRSTRAERPALPCSSIALTAT